MTTRVKIDFVSDVSCPWCVVGLKSLEIALGRLAPDVTAELHLQPFELNADMAPEGEDAEEHLAKKYGDADRSRLTTTRDTLRRRGEQIGFELDMSKRKRIYNTFDAHRLLHWAGLEGKQRELKHALFKAYFQDGKAVSDHGVLAEIAASVGLDAARAQEILASDEYARDVRERERFYARQGIQAVPSVIINDRHLIQGGQPAEVFEQALRQIAMRGEAA